MSKFDDEEDDCTYEDDGECDDAYCEHRRRFAVEVTRTITFTVNAHDEDEATAFADAHDFGYVEEITDELVDEWSDSSPEVTVEDEAEAAARERAFRAEVNRIVAEEAAAFPMRNAPLGPESAPAAG